MFVQTEITPNPNSLKFIPGKVVSNVGSFEITRNDEINNELVKNLLSVNGVEGIFLGKDFISVNKFDSTSWDEIKHIVISLINDFYSSGHEFVIDKDLNENLRVLREKYSLALLEHTYLAKPSRLIKIMKTNKNEEYIHLNILDLKNLSKSHQQLLNKKFSKDGKISR